MFRSLAIVIVILAASTAHASPDTLCLPDTGAAEPAWWNPGLGPNQKESRWQGALTRKLSNGTHGARLRALWSPNAETVYVELSVLGDTSLEPGSDIVVVALGDAAGTAPELFMQIDPTAACGNLADCLGAGHAIDPSSILFSEATSGPSSLTWGPLSSTNPSADFFVDHPWVVVKESAGKYTTVISFALTVPVDAAGDIRPDLRIYGNAITYVPGPTSGTTYEMPILCTSSSVTSNDCIIDPGPTRDVLDYLPVGNLVASWSRLRSTTCLGLAP